MRPALLALIIVANAVFDVGITVGSFGFYKVGWEFNFSDIVATLVVSNYSFLTSPLDFLFFSLIRQLIILIAALLAMFGKSEKLSGTMKLVYGPFICIEYTMVVIKAQFLARNPIFADSPGLQMNLWTTVLWIVTDWFVIQMVINLGKEDGQYRRIENQDNGNVGNGSRASTSTALPNVEGSSNESEEDELPTLIQLSEIWNLMKSNKRRFLLAFGFLIIATILAILEPALYGKIISSLASKEWILTGNTIIFYAIVTILQTKVEGAEGYFKENAEIRTQEYVERKLFGAFMKQDISFFDQHPPGTLTSRLNDCKVISAGLSKHIWTFAKDMITLIVCAPVMVVYSWQLTAVTSATIPFLAVLSKLYAPISKKLSEQQTDNTATANNSASSGLAGIRMIRMLATEEFWLSRYERHTSERTKTALRLLGLTKLYNVTCQSLYSVEGIIKLIFASYLRIIGRLDVEVYFAFIFYHYSVKNALINLNQLFPEVMTTLGSSRALIRHLKQEPLFRYDEGTKRPEVFGQVVFENVTFAYPSSPNKIVVEDVNVTIPEKKTLAIVGPSGGGKSTLVALLERFYKPITGRILLDNIPIEDFEHVYFHSVIAIVSQEPQLFAGSIRENIVSGQVGVTEEELREAARQAHALEFIENLDKGFDTECGEGGTRLSGGEKQRIAIARALIRKPKVLILDEATSALDPVCEQKVKTALKECSVGRTVICIAHRLSTIRHADMIAFVKKGRIVEMGSHEELMGKADSEYRKLVMEHVESLL